MFLIDKFGGCKGVREYEMLSKALSRLFKPLNIKELYPSLLQKAASPLKSMLINQPFINGNKRIGYALMTLVNRKWLRY
jgi:death-on-curing protein